MILPPRPQNHRPLDRSRRTLDLPVTVDPPPPQNRPQLDRFAVPPWNPRSPEWLAIEDSLPADHRAAPSTRRSINSIWLSCSPPISAWAPRPIGPI